MATTYTRRIVSIRIEVFGMEQPIPVTDVAGEGAYAQQALSQFEKGEDVIAVTLGGTVYIPYHAIETLAVVNIAYPSATKPDAYGCDDDSSDGEISDGESSEGIA